MKKNDKRRRSYKKVYKNNKLYIRLIRNAIYFLVGILYLVKETAIETFKDIVRIIVAIIWLLIRFLKAINRFNILIFDRLRKPLKVAFIYTLIVALIITVCEVNVLRNEVHAETIEDKEQVIEFKFDIPKQNPVIEAQRDKADRIKNKVCENEVACKIYEKSLEAGLSTEQAVMLVSISRQETGWDSNALINKNNPAGIMQKDCVHLMVFDTLDEGIDHFIWLVKTKYFPRGMTTLETIKPVYCPDGADNDPNNLNPNWLPNTTQFYNEYLNA